MWARHFVYVKHAVSRSVVAQGRHFDVSKLFIFSHAKEIIYLFWKHGAYCFQCDVFIDQSGVYRTPNLYFFPTKKVCIGIVPKKNYELFGLVPTYATLFFAKCIASHNFYAKSKLLTTLLLEIYWPHL